MSNKKYGLIVPGRTKLVFQASRNVFGNDSDSEEELRKKPMLLRPSDLTNRQAKISQEKAVLEDPTVYQYDEIYDDIVNKKEIEKVRTKEEKKPQYIENLLKAANKRKIENERRLERQIQKEREKEGDEFKDKEVFVTSAYKKKLEDMRIEEEKEKREEYLENIGDVTKQKDLGGFYRHLYEQKLGKSEIKIDSSTKTEEKIIDKDTSTDVSATQIKRNYRKRKSSDSKPSLSDGELEESDEEINHVNLDDIKKAKKCQQDKIDADSDFSIDESSDEEVKEKVEETQTPTTDNAQKDEDKSSVLAEDKKPVLDNEVKQDKPPETVVKIDIWKKRTVGPVFDEALRRYYERKAARSG